MGACVCGAGAAYGLLEKRSGGRGPAAAAGRAVCDGLRHRHASRLLENGAQDGGLLVLALRVHDELLTLPGLTASVNIGAVLLVPWRRVFPRASALSAIRAAPDRSHTEQYSTTNTHTANNVMPPSDGRGGHAPSVCYLTTTTFECMNLSA